MTKAKKKSAKESSIIFHSIMKASVTNTNAIKSHIDREKFFDGGRDFVNEVYQDGKKIELRIYETIEENKAVLIYKKIFKPTDQPSEILTIAKQWIAVYVNDTK